MEKTGTFVVKFDITTYS